MSIVCRSDYKGDELLGFSFCCVCGKSIENDARNSNDEIDDDDERVSIAAAQRVLVSNNWAC